MKKLADLYYSASEHERRMALGIALTFIGAVLLITKAIAGTPANGQSVLGVVSGICGLHMIWQELGDESH